MKVIFVMLMSILLSGCSFFLFSESYQLKDKAGWFNKYTGNEVSNEIYHWCNEKAISEVMGKNTSMGNMTLDKFYKRYPILGECLYQKGYVFKIKGFDMTYCSHYPEECKAYSKYRN